MIKLRCMLYLESISDPSSDMDKKYDQLQIYRKKRKKETAVMFGLFFVLYFVKLSVGNGFWSISPKFGNFPKIQYTNRGKIKKFRDLKVASLDMIIFGKWSW